MYHRIIAAMNVNCMLSSFAMFIGTWAMPKGTSYRIGAAGNRSTCCIQGFLICQGISTTFYYCSLSLYAFVSVREDFNLDKLKRREFLIHLFANAFTLFISIYSATHDILNPSASVCLIEIKAYPIECLQNPDLPCDSLTASKTLRDTIQKCTLLIFFVLIMLTTILVAMVIFIEEKKCRSNKYLKGKKKYIEDFRKKKSGTN